MSEKVQNLFGCKKCGQVYDSFFKALGCEHKRDDKVVITPLVHDGGISTTFGANVSSYHDGYFFESFTISPASDGIACNQEKTLEYARGIIEAIQSSGKPEIKIR